MPSPRAGLPPSSELQVFGQSTIGYFLLPLIWNQAFALVLFAVDEIDWNTAFFL